MSAPFVVNYETSPEKYRHWTLETDGAIATLTMKVDEDGGLREGYKLKLNSYDLGVDIELHDAVQRIRFEHPEVRTVVITGGRDRIFCSGANIFMLGKSSHAWKVNFCKFTNETRNGLEDSSQHSGLKFNRDFFCGYSPERLNTGDKAHRLPTIRKVTSGSTPAVAAEVDALYRQVVTAGTHLASSLRVAEAAKVIENTQRDVNIALMNELSLIFHKLGIDTLEVLQAAGTKWNFLPFRPGLVGGHCIGVDPYYLTHKAQEVGHHPEVILAGRRINDSIATHVADQTVKLMLRKGLPVLGSRVLVLGLTFKENCPDVRNTKVVDIVTALRGDPGAGCRLRRHGAGRGPPRVRRPRRSRHQGPGPARRRGVRRQGHPAAGRGGREAVSAPVARPGRHHPHPHP